MQFTTGLMLIAVLADCSGGAANSGIPAAPTHAIPAGQFRAQLHPAVLSHAGSRLQADATTDSGTIVGSLSADGTSATASAYDSSGTAFATSTVIRNGDGTVTVQTSANGLSSQFSTLDPATVHYGDNALPGGGAMNLDSSTGVATATVTSPQGTIYKVTGTPNADGSATLTVVGSDGSQWTQALAANAATVSAQAKSAAARQRQFSCGTMKDGAGYFGAVSGVATGIAVGGALVGAAPVAAVSGGVAGITAGIAGTMWLIGWASGCPM